MYGNGAAMVVIALELNMPGRADAPKAVMSTRVGVVVGLPPFAPAHPAKKLPGYRTPHMK